ncbi:rRNA maturation RNase YbeY [Parvibacter caecicola]|uniref:rRNA maturation RNase YbeY n=1 Tax=Parvibacter caecicola TaxID=747645 RepID=UPI0023F525EC|nr:rRNA maturation RNase YbeY [Parvibacter caecicola]
MDILISYDYREEDLKPLPLRELTQFVLASEGKPFNTEVSVSFVDNPSIAVLNERFRGIAGPTDVLSFECDNVEDECSCQERGDPIYELGDVVIAADVAEAQTHEYGTSFEEEVSLLLVHGLLHLCGYDHIEDDDAVVMEGREKELLGAWAERRRAEAAE